MQYFSTIVVGIMTAFALVGIIDQLFLKNRLGLGAEFQRGIEMIGPLCLAIVGIIALVPEMKWGIEHTLTPLYRTLGLDPSMAVTSILAIDMGGYQLAESVAIDPLIAHMCGFGDENALVKFFGYHEGISPTSYRSRFFRVHRNAH